MAEDIANYLMVIEKQHLDYLGQIRHWANIKMAAGENVIWIRDITHQQLDAIEIKSIPYKTIYQNRDNSLFLPGHYVPERKMPHLLWTAIDRAIPVTLPPENNNYFGIQQQLTVQLSASQQEHPPYALVTPLAVLKTYIESAPATRLKHLTWVIINKEHCLIAGSPLLPLPGDTLWQHQSFLIPAGFELRLLYEAVNERINPGGDCWIIWNKDGGWYSIKKQQLKPLSLSSFRLSFNLASGIVAL